MTKSLPSTRPAETNSWETPSAESEGETERKKGKSETWVWSVRAHVKRKIKAIIFTSAGHELKSDVIEFLLGIPQSQDKADGNTGIGNSWILQQQQ